MRLIEFLTMGLDLKLASAFPRVVPVLHYLGERPNI